MRVTLTMAPVLPLPSLIGQGSSRCGVNGCSACILTFSYAAIKVRPLKGERGCLHRRRDFFHHLRNHLTPDPLVTAKVSRTCSHKVLDPCTGLGVVTSESCPSLHDLCLE